MNYDLLTPDGTKDYIFEECIMRRNIVAKLSQRFINCGYSEIMTPGLEYYDVFNKNANHIPQDEMYKLTDHKGRLLVLRPESTTPIARVAATRLRSVSAPLRLFYSQGVFVSNAALAGKSNEFLQMGVELIGYSNRLADLEVVTLAMEVLGTSCQNGFNLELGDVGIFNLLVSRLDIADDVKENIRLNIEQKNCPALEQLLDSIGSGDDISALKSLPKLFGGEEIFEKALSVFAYDPELCKKVEYLRNIYTALGAIKFTGSLKIDLGLVSKLDYYTGIVMRGYAVGFGEAVLSGGRYDCLLSEFGYNMPAMGFAVNIDSLATLLLRSGTKPILKKPDLLIFVEQGYEIRALELAFKTRAQGKGAEIYLGDDVAKAKEYAQKRGIKNMTIVTGDKNAANRYGAKELTDLDLLERD